MVNCNLNYLLDVTNFYPLLPTRLGPSNIKAFNQKRKIRIEQYCREKQRSDNKNKKRDPRSAGEPGGAKQYGTRRKHGARGLTKCFFDGTITWEGSLEGKKPLQGLPAPGAAANGLIHNARHRQSGNYTVTL